MEPVFALDAQGGDITALVVVAALAWASLVLALRGSWWAAAIPGAVCALGAYLSGKSDDSLGGDPDPGGLLGVVLLYIGGAWLLVAVAVVLLARWLR